MHLTVLGPSTPGTFDWYAWVVLPALIFFARVCDVTLGTLRIIFVSRGRRNLAPRGLAGCGPLIPYGYTRPKLEFESPWGHKPPEGGF